METEAHCRLYPAVVPHAHTVCGSASAGGVVLLVFVAPDSDD